MRSFVSQVCLYVSALLLGWAERVKAPPPRAMKSSVGGFMSVLPRERRAYERGAEWHNTFGEKRVDFDPAAAVLVGQEFAFKAQGEGNA
jgi:hypothetical protein